MTALTFQNTLTARPAFESRAATLASLQRQPFGSTIISVAPSRSI
jgi:hypothetical protein